MKIINNRLQQAMQMQLFYCLSYVKGEYHIYQWFKHTSCATGENDIPVVSYTPVFSGFGGSLYQIPAGKAQPQNAEIELVNYYDNHSFLNFNGFHKKDACYNILNGGSSTNARNLLTGTVMRSSDGSMLCSVTYYDHRHRPSDVRRTYADGVAVVMTTEYSFTGKPLTVQYSVCKDGAAIPMTIENTYGEANDLPVSSVLKANGCETVLASNEYDGLGRLSKGTRGSNALYQQYSYNVRGWLTQITGNGFREELYYTDGAVPCYNGDISRVKWNGDTSTPTHSSYDFRYDSLDRLVASEYTLHADTDKNFDNSEYFTYNSNGSPLTLKRHGRYMITDRDIGYAIVNDMSFSYDGNRLTGISDAGFYSGFTSPYVFHENISADIGYAYNSNGSMTRNPDRHIGLIEYDCFNNPRLIQFTDGSATEYVYDASGTKLKTVHRTAVPGIEVPYGTVYAHTSSTLLSSDSTLYAGPFVLSGDSLRYKYDGGSVMIPLDGSPVKPCFYALDHLGSVRLVVSADGQVIERNDYYPSGCLITENIDGETVILPYKYNGKELDPMHGLYTYDYGARQYDPATTLWDRMDPLCEKYYNVSPYVYCGDNPVNAIDPDGKKVIPIRFIGSGEVTYYRSPLQFQKAMIAFGKTSFGRQILADFTPKDKYIYGVRGNGKYADYNLVIEEIDYTNSKEQFLHFNKNPYNTINATTEMLNVDGKPAFYVQFNVQRTQEELTETVSHEFTVHLSDYNDIIKAYEKEMRYSDAKRLWNSVPESKQHNDMVNKKYKYKGTYNYYKTSEELKKQNPQLEKVFEDAYEYNKKHY